MFQQLALRAAGWLYAQFCTESWAVRIYDSNQNVVVEHKFRAVPHLGHGFWSVTEELSMRKVVMRNALGDLICGDAVPVHAGKLGLHTEAALREFFKASRRYGAPQPYHGFLAHD